MNKHKNCCCHDHSKCCGESENHESQFKECFGMIVSAVLLIAGLIMQTAHVALLQNETVRLLWYVVAYLPVGVPVMKEAVESICHKDFFSEFLLMSIATIGAFAIGEYPEGVSVMLLYCIGEFWQDRAVAKAKGNINALLSLKPETAEVIRNGQAETVSPQDVKVGETVCVKPGERVPLDGTLQTERASFNTSALTGESVPRNIKNGEEVLSGMIVCDAEITITVLRPFSESALSRIIDMVQNASERKAPTELFIRRFARVYTPVVVALAVLIQALPFVYSLFDSTFQFVYADWLYKSLIFLVVSCPCALVISIPLGYFSGIGAASRRGILFKGGNYLDAVTHLNTIVFDKTGTLTKGTFDVTRCVTSDSSAEASRLMVECVAAVESGSTHPIAKAVVRYAEGQGFSGVKAENIKEIAGMGLTAEYRGKQVMAGNARLLRHFGIDYPEEVDAEVNTIVACAIDNRYAGYLVLSDTLKDDAREAIDHLKRLGISDIEMLSGDKQAIVQHTAHEIGITQAYGGLLPSGKLEHIEALRKNAACRVAFVGDGMNDAPVLALSDVGIAMGGLGSDVAIETADVVIQTDQPSKVAIAIEIGRATKSIVRQNIVFALGVKVLIMLLGLLGLANLWAAVFADVGVTLLAVANTMRLQFFCIPKMKK